MHIRPILRLWLPSAAVAVVLSVVVYVAVQQSIRQAANDPLVQLSEDAIARLEAGQSPKLFLGSAPVEVSKNVAVWAIVYDDAGATIASLATLDGASIAIPAEVLDWTRAHGQDRLTWQPRAGVRAAIVVTRYQTAKGAGFVVVGRSLREIEYRERGVLLICAAGLLLSLVVSLVVAGIALRWRNPAPAA